MSSQTTNYHLVKHDSTDDYEDFRAAYNDNMDIIDQNLGGGGGGGGGHTIVDPAGTEVAQEPKMQFTGKVNVSDDSTNQKTIVNMPAEVVPITRAEYEALPETKLTDGKAYFITDSISARSNEYPPLIYSTYERQVGVWTDGKPLYQKTITFDCSNTSNVQTAYSIPTTHFIVAVLDAYFENSYNNLSQQFRYTWYKDHFWSYIVNNSGHAISVHRETTDGNWQSGVKFVAIIQYTKTTDVAGSGKWNGQGGIACHYSTNETVVGTWTDGKPLYQRTIEQNSTNVSGTEVQVDLSSWNIDECVEVSGFFDRVVGGNKSTYYFNSREFGASNEYWGFVKYHNANKYLAFSIKLTSSTTSKQVITLLYTKTTD